MVGTQVEMLMTETGGGTTGEVEVVATIGMAEVLVAGSGVVIGVVVPAWAMTEVEGVVVAGTGTMDEVTTGMTVVEWAGQDLTLGRGQRYEVLKVCVKI